MRDIVGDAAAEMARALSAGGAWGGAEAERQAELRDDDSERHAAEALEAVLRPLEASGLSERALTLELCVRFLVGLRGTGMRSTHAESAATAAAVWDVLRRQRIAAACDSRVRIERVAAYLSFPSGPALPSRVSLCKSEVLLMLLAGAVRERHHPVLHCAPAEGAVVWITGMAGAGKTTLAGALCAALAIQSRRLLIHLDGDALREKIWAGRRDEDYSVSRRRHLARCNGALCAFLASLGATVVCSTISLYHAQHARNRRRIARYLEVYLRASPELLRHRDTKGLYSSELQRLAGRVVGHGQPAELPLGPDVVVDADHSDAGCDGERIASLLAERGWL